MRKKILIPLVLGGIFVSAMAVSTTVTRTETDVTNNQIYRGMTGLHVSLPSNMKNFREELIPVP
jgi:hypothetical protein